MIERTSINISLEFIGFISTPARYQKALFRSELERGLLKYLSPVKKSLKYLIA